MVVVHEKEHASVKLAESGVEVLSTGKQVLLPGSRHPGGGRYEVVDAGPPARVAFPHCHASPEGPEGGGFNSIVTFDFVSLYAKLLKNQEANDG